MFTNFCEHDSPSSSGHSVSIITITAFVSGQNINYTVAVIVHNFDPAIDHIVVTTEYLCIIFTTFLKYF